MGRRQKKKKKGKGMAVFLSFVIILGVFYLFILWKFGSLGAFKEMASGFLMDKVTKQATEKILENVVDPETADKIKEVTDQMDEEDKQQVQDIIKKYADQEKVSEIVDIVGNGINEDTLHQAEEYLKESISKEDFQKLRELYEKYKDAAGTE